MCMNIDDSVTSLNKRVVWKVFDKQYIVGHQEAIKLGVERAESRILQALHPSESAMRARITQFRSSA